MTATMKYSDFTLGQVEAVFNKLGGVEGVQRFLRGDSEVVIKTRTIDCDRNPHIPSFWQIEENIEGGQLVWNPDRVKLYLCDKQQGGTIEGNKLRKLLKDKSVLNANVLDYLLENPHLIPEEWKGKYVFFWGTIYRNPKSELFVRYLGWNGEMWHWSSYQLDERWNDDDHAALLCKSLCLDSRSS